MPLNRSRYRGLQRGGGGSFLPVLVDRNSRTIFEAPILNKNKKAPHLKLLPVSAPASELYFLLSGDKMQPRKSKVRNAIICTVYLTVCLSDRLYCLSLSMYFLTCKCNFPMNPHVRLFHFNPSSRICYSHNFLLYNSTIDVLTES